MELVTTPFTAAAFATSTLLGGAGADTAVFTGLVGDSTINLSGSGASLISASGGVDLLHLIGGGGADTIDFTVVASLLLCDWWWW